MVTAAKSFTGSKSSLVYRLGVVTWLPAGVTKVWPSGAAFAPMDVPSVPPAPPRLSMMIGWPSASDRRGITARVTTSATPPAANGTMKRIGLAGQAWAKADTLKTVPAVARARASEVA